MYNTELIKKLTDKFGVERVILYLTIQLYAYKVRIVAGESLSLSERYDMEFYTQKLTELQKQEIHEVY